MAMSFPKTTKQQTQFYLRRIPFQSRKVYYAVTKKINPIKEHEFDFNKFMNELFFSNDILLRTAYYHIKVQLDKNHK